MPELIQMHGRWVTTPENGEKVGSRKQKIMESSLLPTSTIWYRRRERIESYPKFHKPFIRGTKMMSQSSQLPYSVKYRQDLVHIQRWPGGFTKEFSNHLYPFATRWSCGNNRNADRCLEFLMARREEDQARSGKPCNVAKQFPFTEKKPS